MFYLSVIMLHHLMVGTWTPPGSIYTIEFDDKALTLKLVNKTSIPEDEPISWMTFDVSGHSEAPRGRLGLRRVLHKACKEEHLWSLDEEILKLYR